MVGDRPMAMMDAQWAALVPLVEACRPTRKRPPQQLAADDRGDRLAALQRRDMAGAAARVRGRWWRAAQLFIRWSRWASGNACCTGPGAGRRTRPGAARRVRDPGVIPRRREPHKGATPGVPPASTRAVAWRLRHQSLRRCRRPWPGGAFALAPGGAHDRRWHPDCSAACCRAVPPWVVGDRGYSPNALRDRSGP